MNMELNKYYDLSVYADVILGSAYKSAKLIGILNYENARKFEPIYDLHKQVYPRLPEGTPSDYTKYTYYQFQVEDKTIIIADVWIVPGSVTLREGVSYTIIIEDASSSDINDVRDSLRGLGLTFTIS